MPRGPFRLRLMSSDPPGLSQDYRAVAVALAPENTAQALGWLWDGLVMGVEVGTGLGTGQEPDMELGVGMGLDMGVGTGRERFQSFRVVCPETPV